MIFAKFLFFTKGRRSIQRGVTGVRQKINSVLFAGKLMVSIILPHKDLPYFEDFLEEDKESQGSLKVTRNFHG